MRAILITNNEDQYQASLENVGQEQLPDGDVTVNVQWSGYNFKDGLALTGKAPVVRRFPMVPGIDLAGVVEVSEDSRYQPGDHVFLNGWGVGEKHWGGYAEKCRVKADWLLTLPAGMTLKQTMAIGTAGYTAMLCVLALEKNNVTPDKGEILVTGATGGVGSIAIALLSKLGYDVVAVTGQAENHDYLKTLGASEILHRDEFASQGKPLAKERWAGAVDVVGSHTLANICASTRYGGTVTACGLAGGMELPATVAPFILRGVTLVGIDSVMCPMSQRQAAWHRLATDLDLEKLEMMTHQIQLDHVIDFAKNGLSNQQPGKTVVQVQG
ncbi:MAG: oxidoreductase [Phycisphaeraceae bacterium]|nr:oxidoreductase [Phycisphaeraceae bacterium]